MMIGDRPVAAMDVSINGEKMAFASLSGNEPALSITKAIKQLIVNKDTAVLLAMNTELYVMDSSDRIAYASLPTLFNEYPIKTIAQLNTAFDAVVEYARKHPNTDGGFAVSDFLYEDVQFDMPDSE
jgi:hypothetical protein